MRVLSSAIRERGRRAPAQNLRIAALLSMALVIQVTDTTGPCRAEHPDSRPTWLPAREDANADQSLLADPEFDPDTVASSAAAFEAAWESLLKLQSPLAEPSQAGATGASVPRGIIVLSAADGRANYGATGSFGPGRLFAPGTPVSA